MSNPTTAAGWLRGIPHLDSQQIALLEVALESHARQRVEEAQVLADEKCRWFLARAKEAEAALEDIYHMTDLDLIEKRARHTLAAIRALEP